MPAYNKKVDILVSQDISDKVGNTDCVWKKILTAWASVNSTGGRKFYEAAQTNTQNYMTFTVRWCRTLSTLRIRDTRIRYNGRLYEVQHIDDFYEQHRELVIRAEEVL